MPTRVELPDGTFVVIPDDASEEDLNEFKSILRERFPEETVPEDPGLGSRTLSSLQRGFEDLGGAYKSISKILANASKSLSALAVNLILSPVSKTIFEAPASSSVLSAGTLIVEAIIELVEPSLSKTLASTVAAFVPSTFVILAVRTIATLEPGQVYKSVSDVVTSK